MSKELSPLEAFDYIKNNIHYFEPVCQEDEDKRNEANEIVEKELKEKEQQDGILKILKEIIQFSTTMPQIKPNEDNGFDMMSCVGIKIQRDIENREREILRQWVLKTCFPKELQALEIIKKYGYFDFYTNELIVNVPNDKEEEFKLLEEVGLWFL